MEIIYLEILLIALGYFVLIFRVGAARGKYDVPAPAMTGHATFERRFRVHQNTAETLVVFLPALLLFAIYVSEFWAAVLGGLFIVFRFIYVVRYEKDPPSRQIGYLPGFFITLAMVIGAVFGIAMELAKTAGGA